jgi:putative ABC transport system ATP-binding protein
LMITHDLHQALAVGNRTIMMHEGDIVYELKGDERKKASVSTLLSLFEKARGREFSNDRMMLI